MGTEHRAIENSIEVKKKKRIGFKYVPIYYQQSKVGILPEVG